MPTDIFQDTPSTLRSLFGYKAWANEELFAALALVDAVKHLAEANTAIRILNHVYVVDCIFKAHLAGDVHDYAATNTKETPALSTLAAAAKEVDAWFVAYVNNLPNSSLQEQIRFVFTDGDAGLMSREEMLLHVVTHGGYHRGAAGQVMRTASVAPPRDLYTRFLHTSEPGRRQ
ncbi:MAG: damage-inducible protein DinB [Glaciimonas sp.]|nr:damage-inducible protein DinB [Glaciimonas sp.]